MLEPFSDIVGQEKIKAKLRFHLDNYRNTGIFPVLFFAAGKGEGKTFFSKSIFRNLLDEDGNKKPLIELNCASLPSGTKFFDDVWADHIQGKRINCLVDEAHLLNKDLATSFLSLFNVTSENKNTLKLDTFTAEVDFSLQTFIFASSEPQRVLDTLIDRCELLTFEPYQNQDLEKIIKTGAKCDFEDGILSDMVPRLRGNPRAAQKLSKSISVYAKSRGLNKICQKHWLEIKKNLDLLHSGLNQLELKLLKILEANGPTTLNHLSAKMSMSKSAVMNNVENFLHKHSLISITENGRVITHCGKQLLRHIEQEA